MLHPAYEFYFPDAGFSNKKQNTGEVILQILSSLYPTHYKVTNTDKKNNHRVNSKKTTVCSGLINWMDCMYNLENFIACSPKLFDEDEFDIIASLLKTVSFRHKKQKLIKRWLMPAFYKYFMYTKNMKQILFLTMKNCFRYLKLMSPLNVAICTTISYTLWMILYKKTIIWPWGQRSRSHKGHYGMWHTALWSCTHIPIIIDLSRKTKMLWPGEENTI